MRGRHSYFLFLFYFLARTWVIKEIPWLILRKSFVAQRILHSVHSKSKLQDTVWSLALYRLLLGLVREQNIHFFRCIMV